MKWLVNNLAMIGRTDEAEEMLDHLLSVSSDLGWVEFRRQRRLN
jgi:GH15 family glucan-1,4-alpha-glucosidase